MASNFQPPPTYADVIIQNDATGKGSFNPIWLNWFLYIAQYISVNGGSTSGTIATLSGTYTPAVVGSPVNVLDSAVEQCLYSRVGDMVVVAGQVSVTPAVVGITTAVSLSLPIASSLTQELDCRGVAGGTVQPTLPSGANLPSVRGDLSTSGAAIRFTSGTNTPNELFFTFMYQVK